MYAYMQMEKILMFFIHLSSLSISRNDGLTHSAQMRVRENATR